MTSVGTTVWVDGDQASLSPAAAHGETQRQKR
jgi:hypothetical protein